MNPYKLATWTTRNTFCRTRYLSVPLPHYIA